MIAQEPWPDPADLRIYLAVVDAGSFSKVAKLRGVSVSSVSRRVAEVEARVGIELLSRTGRGVRATVAGERFAERARRVLEELEGAIAEARGERARAPTRLRVSAAGELALRLLPGPVAELTARWPALSIEVSTDTRHVSLLEEDFDAAIRIGTLALSANLARPLGSITMRVYAAPALAARLTRPAQLASMRVLRVLGPRARPGATWRGRPVDLEGSGAPVRVATFTEAAELAARAPFLTVLPSYTALPYVERGLLAPAGRGLALPASPVHLIAPTAARGSVVHAALGDALADALARIEDALGRASR